METVWISCRISYNETYETRHNALQSVVVGLDASAWDEPASFYFVRTNRTPRDVCRMLARVIDTESDVVIVGATTIKGVFVAGQVDDEDGLKEKLPGVLRRE